MSILKIPSYQDKSRAATYFSFILLMTGTVDGAEFTIPLRLESTRLGAAELGRPAEAALAAVVEAEGAALFCRDGALLLLRGVLLVKPGTAQKIYGFKLYWGLLKTTSVAGELKLLYFVWRDSGVSHKGQISCLTLAIMLALRLDSSTAALTTPQKVLSI